VARIGDTLTRIYEQADAEGVTTAEAAERLAAERLTVGAVSATARDAGD
jgi:leucine dehydrogenase